MPILEDSLKHAFGGMPQIVHQQLRLEIQDGRIPPGTQLRQDALAQRFNTSRFPVREALRMLESEGLVTYRRNRGAVVAAMTIQELREIMEIRLALECYAAKMAVPKMVQMDLENLSQILAKYDECDTPQEWGDHNRRFHLALCAPANNSKLQMLIENFCLNTDRYMHEAISKATGREKPQNEHYAILEACKERDAEKVACLLQQHILETTRDIIAADRIQKENS